MTTGSTLSRALATKRSDIERNLRGLAAQFGAIEQELGILVSEEVKLWNEFAAIQIGETAALPTQIEAMLDSRRRKIEAKQAEAAAAEERVKELSSRRNEAKAAAEKAETAYSAAKAEVRAAFEADPSATALRVDLTHLEEAAAGLRAKHERAVAELTEKRVAYERDELFSYLLARKHGTQEYKGWGFVARVDGWLSNLTGHRRKAADYGRLSDIPRWIESRLAKVSADLSAKAAEVQAVRDRHYAPAQPLADAARKAAAELAAVDRLIEKQEATVHEASAFVTDAARATDAEMKKALKSFADILARKGIESLKQAALMTRTEADDRIVVKLGDIAARRAKLEDQADQLRPGIAEFEKRVKAIGEIESKLRARGWTGSDDRFSSRVGTSKVDELGDGLITAASMWSLLQSAHQPPRDYGSSSSTSWSGSRSGSLGGFGSDSGGSSGGGFGGGSWSTGGGFGGSDSSSGGGF